MGEQLNLKFFRREIELVTLKIMCLAGERLLLARKIAEIKQHKNLPIEHSIIEKKLRKAVLKKCGIYGISEDFGLKLLDLLIEEAKREQKKAINGVSG